MNFPSARCRRALGALAFLVPFISPAHAAAPGDQADTPQVRTRLAAAADAVHPGERVLFGVEQRLLPGWHTYWVNPGDTGVAARIVWDLPAGAEAGAIEWPTPARFRTGPVTSHGYDDHVTLLSTLAVPAHARPGTSFSVRAHVSWLVCKDVCIPQQADLRLALPVQAAGVPAGPGALAADTARAALPQALPAGSSVLAATDGRGVGLTLAGKTLAADSLEDAWFYAAARGAVAPGAAQTVGAGPSGKGLELTLRAGEQPVAAGGRLDGVLVVKTRTAAGSATRGYRIDVPLGASAAPISLPGAAQDADDPAPAAGLQLASALVLALLGGLVLNAMPCVFPVLSIKALSLLQHGGEDRRTARLHGIVYTLGVLASFALLGSALIVLKAGGAQAGWGFQFQSPAFVLAASFLMFAVGLNLSGVFEIGASLAGAGSSLAARPGLTGSFFTGVLATVVATPCTAPFMGGAVAFALAQPPARLLAAFLSMGLGLALPYLLLSIWPALQRRLPRPGAWMVAVRQALAFPMYAASAWLVWVLARQAGLDALPLALGGMVAIGFAAWLYGATRGSRRRVVGSAAALLVAAGALGAGLAGVHAAPPATLAGAGASDDAWVSYSPERLQSLRAHGQPVFLNLTASWCITCLVNERVALEQASVAEAFREAGVVRLKGDWTNGDAAITALLARFDRSGVPLYVFYPAGAGSQPVILPQLLTPKLVLGAIDAKIVAKR